MSASSTIEWTDASWNPVTGCTEVSPGCDHCYAKTFAERWRDVSGHPFEQGFDLKLWAERLELPLRWRKPRLTRPSDLGYSDDGYDLPPLRVHEHRLASNHADAGFDQQGQGKLLRDSSITLSDAAREKRETLALRIAKAKEIIEAGEPGQHWIIWHDLEDERRAIEVAFPEAVTVYGTQDLDERERAIIDFSDGAYTIELSPEYHEDAVSYLRAAEADLPMPTLFAVAEAEAAGS